MKPDINSIQNSVDPDQLASEEASWSGSTLFSTQYTKFTTIKQYEIQNSINFLKTCPITSK